jgi:hypothetical protein
VRDRHNEQRRASEAKIKERLIALVGELAIEWAAMEMELDGAIEILHQCGGAEKIQADLPVSMKNKLAYLRRADRIVDPELAETTAFVADQVGEMKLLRSDLMHGVAGDFNFQEGAWSFERYQFKKDKRSSVHTSYRHDELSHGVLRIMRLRVAVIRLAHATEIMTNPKIRQYRDN